MSQNTRRQFLTQTATGAAAAFTAPWIIPSSAFGANERIITEQIVGDDAAKCVSRPYRRGRCRSAFPG